MPNHKKSKKKNSISFCVFIAVILFVAITFLSSPTIETSKTIEISQGTSSVEIANILKDNDIIRSRVLFLIKASMPGTKGTLKYGEFEFSPQDNLDNIITKLKTGGKTRKTVTVTIPEGYSCKKIIEILTKNGLSTKEELTKAINSDYDYEFLKSIDFPNKIYYKLEGFLFPSTYEFYQDSTAREIVSKMLSEFEKQYNLLNATYNDIYTVITKASMIEREAVCDTDRPLIAGVIENRLKKDMRLQIDATVIYAISKGNYDIDRVLYSDLEVISPYNTYNNKGLPLGPISNPGKESIKAALSPAKHNYLYYRTDENKNDGSHIFSETFEEHKTANN